ILRNTLSIPFRSAASADLGMPALKIGKDSLCRTTAGVVRHRGRNARMRHAPRSVEKIQISVSQRVTVRREFARAAENRSRGFDQNRLTRHAAHCYSFRPASNKRKTNDGES